MSEFLCAVLQAAREIIPLLAMREEHLLQAGAKGAGGDISIGADLLCEEIFTKHLSHIGHIDSEESGFIAAGLQNNKDFSDKAQTLSSRDLHQQVVAIHKSTQIDCHADKSARNDKNLSKPAKDSGTSPSDSKIVELESGFFEPRKEIRLGCLSTQCGDEIHDSSPQAESPKQNEDSRATLTIVLDPLDGSDNYLSNIPYYGASLALCDGTGAVLEAAVVNFCSAQVIYDHSSAPHASRIHIFTQEHSPLAPAPAKCGVFEKAYSYPDIARELYVHKLKFRSLGASALSLAYALEHNFFLFCGAIRKYDALAGLFLCRNLHIARGADFLLVSQNKQVFGMIEQILSKHHIKQI